MEWHERGMLNMHQGVVIGRTNRWWQSKTELAENPEKRLVCIQDNLKTRDLILKKTKPTIPRKRLYPDFEVLKMLMVKSIMVVDEPLLFMDKDKASEEADRISK